MTGEESSGGQRTDGSETAAGAPGGSHARGRFLCDLCGSEMLDRHCKLLCLRCGYQRDCSDP